MHSLHSPLKLPTKHTIRPKMTKEKTYYEKFRLDNLDFIPIWIVADCAAEHRCDIFKVSRKLDVFPQAWKFAKATVEVPRLEREQHVTAAQPPPSPILEKPFLLADTDPRVSVTQYSPVQSGDGERWLDYHWDRWEWMTCLFLFLALLDTAAPSPLPF